MLMKKVPAVLLKKSFEKFLQLHNVIICSIYILLPLLIDVDTMR